MKNAWKILAAGGAAYITWAVLDHSSRKDVSERNRGSLFVDALKHYMRNILVVALWKTFQERSDVTNYDMDVLSEIPQDQPSGLSGLPSQKQ